MVKNKKGAADSGGAVAVILLLIALFMVFYILFIPPADRDALLNPNNDSTSSSGTISSSGKTELLFASPGLLNPNEEFGTSHPIQDINLFVKTEPKLSKLADNVNIENGLFSKSFPVLRFQSSDLSETKSAALSFFISKADGELRIKLNKNTIYSEEVSGSVSKIVNLAVQDLKENNELEFSVSSPGLAFWSTNNYNLKDISFKQEFNRINSEEERLVSVSQQEIDTLQSVKLKYTQICNQPLSSGNAPLTIYINNKRASSAYITCVTTDQSLDVDSSLLVVGNNKIQFKLEEGDFMFSQINLETKASDSKFPTFTFLLPTAEFNLVADGSKIVTLDLGILKTRGVKTARIIVNNNELMLSTEDAQFSRDISTLVVEGTNIIQIIPTSIFKVPSLKVTLK